MKYSTWTEASICGAFLLLTIMREFSVLRSDTVLSQAYKVDVQYFMGVPHSGVRRGDPWKGCQHFPMERVRTSSHLPGAALPHAPRPQRADPVISAPGRNLQWNVTVKPLLKTNVFSVWQLWSWPAWWRRRGLGVGVAEYIPDREIRPLPLAWLFWDLFIHSP